MVWKYGNSQHFFPTANNIRVTHARPSPVLARSDIRIHILPVQNPLETRLIHLTFKFIHGIAQLKDPRVKTFFKQTAMNEL